MSLVPSKSKWILRPCSNASAASEQVYKCAYVSARLRGGVVTKQWFKIDPHKLSIAVDSSSSCSSLESASYLEIPTYLDLHKLQEFTSLVYESKVYFIGGFIAPRFQNSDFYNDPNPNPNKGCSGKMFICDLNLKTWKESESKLNIPRYAHATVIINHVIYVMGGVTYLMGGISPCTDEMNPQHQWIELYDLKNPDPHQAWQFLSTANRTPEILYNNSKMVSWNAHYERGTQILFYIHNPSHLCHEIFSFNYVTLTWMQYSMNMVVEYGPVACNDPVIIDDFMYWEWFGYLYAYDLRRQMVVMEYCLGFIATYLSNQNRWMDYPSDMILVSVRKDTLLLIWKRLDSPPGKPVNEAGIYCYRFRIDKSSSSLEGSCVLIPEGNEHLLKEDLFELDHCFVA